MVAWGVDDEVDFAVFNHVEDVGPAASLQSLLMGTPASAMTVAVPLVKPNSWKLLVYLLYNSSSTENFCDFLWVLSQIKQSNDNEAGAHGGIVETILTILTDENSSHQS